MKSGSIDTAPQTSRFQAGPHGATNLLPALAVLGSIVSLTIGATVAKGLFPAIGAQGTTALRLGIAAVLLCAIWRPWRTPLAGRDLAVVALYGLILGLMNMMFYMALRTIPIGVAIAIEFIGPLTVAVLASRRAVDFVWIGCAVLGLALLVPRGDPASTLDPAGLGYVSVAAVLWGCYIVVGQRAGRLHGGRAVALGLVAASCVALPVGIVHAGAALLAPSILAAGLVVAILSSAIPYSLEMLALQRLPKQTFGILLSLEPAVGALAAFLILDQRLMPTQVAAIGAIIVASVGSTLTARRRPPAPTCEA